VDFVPFKIFKGVKHSIQYHTVKFDYKYFLLYQNKYTMATTTTTTTNTNTNTNTTTNTNRVEQMKVIQQEALELFTRKNIDYGDAFAKYGVIGVLMRIEDKIQRSMSITKNGVNLINDEGIRDTLIDLHNYAAMALMLLDE
jgi:hypothetical protein